jgi:hypothetical protein
MKDSLHVEVTLRIIMTGWEETLDKNAHMSLAAMFNLAMRLAFPYFVNVIQFVILIKL